MKSKLIIGFLVFTQLLLSQAPAPIIRCVQRSTNGNTITWTNPVAACGSLLKTYIYFSNSPTGPFILHDSSTTNTYLHTPVSQNLIYYYYLISLYNCPIPISSPSDTFEDSPVPTPKLRSISIENGKPVYHWEPIPLRDEIWGYVIITPNALIDTVQGRASGTFTDTNFDASSGPYQGAVAAMDSCGGINGRSGFLYQKTSFLSLYDNPCNGTLNLSWTPYIGWTTNNDVAAWEILVKKNNGSEIVVARVDPAVRAYIYSDYVYGDTLEVRVRAIHPSDPSIISYTNTYAVISKKSVKPVIFHSTTASYIRNFQVKLSWMVDLSTRPKAFHLIKKTVKYGDELSRRTNIPFYNDGQGNYHAVDDLGSQEQPVLYELSLEDSCNNIYLGVPTATVFLNLTQVGFYRNELKWTESIFPDSVAYTILNRELSYSIDGLNFNPLLDYSGNNQNYLHDIEQIPNPGGYFCYRLKLQYKLDTASGVRDTMRTIYSQIACVTMRTILWVPNAFKVSGINPTFKPMLVFFETDDFEMKIYNRWGQEIFQTKDHQLGWNGMLKNGTTAPEDSYMYVISYRGNDQVQVTKTGNFVLIK